MFQCQDRVSIQLFPALKSPRLTQHHVSCYPLLLRKKQKSMLQLLQPDLWPITGHAQGCACQAALRQGCGFAASHLWLSSFFNRPVSPLLVAMNRRPCTGLGRPNSIAQRLKLCCITAWIMLTIVFIYCLFLSWSRALQCSRSLPAAAFFSPGHVHCRPSCGLGLLSKACW